MKWKCFLGNPKDYNKFFICDEERKVNSIFHLKITLGIEKGIMKIFCEKEKAKPIFR